MNGSTVPVITIDGPVGSGKGTVSRQVARALDWNYLDSGALYRALAYSAALQDVSPDQEDKLVELSKGMTLRFQDEWIFLDGEEIGKEIRSERIGDLASRIAGLSAIRKALLDWQRSCARFPGLVADGRDMGTVVFPDAGCKIFLTASAEERANRRFNQLRDKGFDVNIQTLIKEITQRDRRDSDRGVSPLQPAKDAMILDTTGMSIEQSVEHVLQFADQRAR